MVKENVGKYCNGCADKRQGCHTKCFAYNVAYAKYKLDKAKEQEARRIDYLYDAYLGGRKDARKRGAER